MHAGLELGISKGIKESFLFLLWVAVKAVLNDCHTQIGEQNWHVLELNPTFDPSPRCILVCVGVPDIPPIKEKGFSQEPAPFTRP